MEVFQLNNNDIVKRVRMQAAGRSWCSVRLIHHQVLTPRWSDL